MELDAIYIWVGTSNPFNSIFIQVKKHQKLIEDTFLKKTIILHPGVDNVKKKIKRIIKKKELLFWHYGGFDTYLLGLKKREIIFVYHNITPAKYFWSYDPLVSIRSFMGSIQLRLINKNSEWITMSPFNLNELKKIGIKKTKIFPNIIENKRDYNVDKTNQISLIFVGRISPNKNCVRLLEEIEKTSNNLSIQVEFTIVGKVKPGCKYGAIFTEKYKELESNPYLKLKWVKEIDEKKLIQHYQKAWLYVSMSLHEGFGVPACESIANGTPALYLECGGQESILLDHGKVNLSDQHMFSDYLSNIIISDSEREQLLSKQKEIVCDFFEPKVNSILSNIFNSYIKN